MASKSQYPSKRILMIDKIADEILDRSSERSGRLEPITDRVLVLDCLQSIFHHLSGVWVEDLKAHPEHVDTEKDFSEGAHRVFEIIRTSTDYRIGPDRIDMAGFRYRNKKVA